MVVTAAEIRGGLPGAYGPFGLVYRRYFRLGLRHRGYGEGEGGKAHTRTQRRPEQSRGEESHRVITSRFVFKGPH